MQTHPRPFRLRRRFGAVAAATGLVLTGCNAGSEGAADDGEGGAQQSVAADEYESPIGDFLGVDYDYDEDDEQRWIDEANAAEQRIAECMRAEGFEYTPVDQGQYMLVEGMDEEFEWGSRAWTEKYGFGQSTQMFPQSEVGADLVGYDDSYEESMDEEFVDPNYDYQMSLSDDERQAYETALWGDQPEFDETLSEEEMDELWMNWEPTGCQSVAWEDSWGDSAEGQFYETFSEELDDLYERIDADPRIVEAERAAEACVVEAGQLWLEDEDLWDHFYEQLSDIGMGFEGDPFEAAGLDPETMSDEEIDAFFNEMNTLDDDDRARLAEVQAAEIEMALVYYDCGAGWMGRDEVWNEVRVELEQQFLDEHADELAEFEGAGAGD